MVFIMVLEFSRTKMDQTTEGNLFRGTDKVKVELSTKMATVTKGSFCGI